MKGKGKTEAPPKRGSGTKIVVGGNTVRIGTAKPKDTNKGRK